MENRNNRGGMRGPGMGRRPAEKSKDFKGTWMKIIRYCKRYLAVIVVALICAVAGTILTILGPDKLSDLTKVITEGIATGIDMERVKSIGLTLVAFYVGSAILSFGQQFIMATVTQNVTKQLRSDISGKINRLPMAYYNKTSTGDVLSRVTNDVDMISQSMNQSIGNLVSAVALFFGSLIMMFKTNVIMTLTAVIATMIGFGLMSLITSHSQKYFSRQQANLGALNGHIEEIYSGHTVVKAYNGEKNAKKVFDELNNNLRDSAFKAQSLSGLMQPLMAFIGNFGYVAVCVMGAVLTMKGYIGFEVIVAFMSISVCLPSPLRRSHRQLSPCSLRQQPVSVYLLSLGQRKCPMKAIKQRSLAKQKVMWILSMSNSAMKTQTRSLFMIFQPRQNRDRRSRLSVRQVPARRHW